MTEPILQHARMPKRSLAKVLSKVAVVTGMTSTSIYRYKRVLQYVRMYIRTYDQWRVDGGVT